MHASNSCCDQIQARMWYAPMRPLAHTAVCVRTECAAHTRVRMLATSSSSCITSSSIKVSRDDATLFRRLLCLTVDRSTSFATGKVHAAVQKCGQGRNCDHEVAHNVNARANLSLPLIKRKEGRQQECVAPQGRLLPRAAREQACALGAMPASDEAVSDLGQLLVPHSACLRQLLVPSLGFRVYGLGSQAFFRATCQGNA
jgi:hypothetical protein